MKKKFKFLFALSAVAATVISLGVSSKFFRVELSANAENDNYSVTWTKAERTVGDNVIFKTTLGNEITFKTTKMVAKNKMVSLDANGTIENLPSKENMGIGQIKSVTLDYTTDDNTDSYVPGENAILGLEYGYQDGDKVKYIKTVDFKKTLNFKAGNYPSYIRIHNNHTGVVNFNEISLTYGCTAHDSYEATDFKLTFDNLKEDFYDWSKVGEIENGGLHVTTPQKIKLANPIVMKPNKPWTLQFKTKATNDKKNEEANGTILTEGENSSKAFINLPDAKSSNRNYNGFTISDRNAYVKYLFKKDNSKLTNTNTFIMTYDGIESLHAYQNDVEITGDNIDKKGKGTAKETEVTFNYLFSGLDSSKYDYKGIIYDIEFKTSFYNPSKA